jgi:VanZ family protein
MLKAYRLTLFLSLVILILSVISLGKLPKLEVRAGDKIGHFLAYAALCSVLLFEHAKRKRWSTEISRWLIGGIVLSGLYGVCMELLQASSISNRNFDYYDMLANFTGALAGAVLFRLAYQALRRRFSGKH